MAQVNDPPALHQSRSQRSRSLAISSLVIGIIALIVSWLSIIGLVVSVVAVVLGVVALRKSQSNKLSIAGVVTGGIGLIISIYLASTAGFLMDMREDCACAPKLEEPVPAESSTGLGFQ
ncbi:MAG: hypothetical protein HLX51_09315 [Micrococcaceae bacterium]|nr:hypothetical protein [Micrococcaceae bacterium]